MKIYIFRTVPLSIIRSLCTVHLAVEYVYKPVWHIPMLSVRWINFWWWTEELSETCRVSCKNKFVKLVHLVGDTIKKFVTLHGHTNVKKYTADVCQWPHLRPWHALCPLTLWRSEKLQLTHQGLALYCPPHFVIVVLFIFSPFSFKQRPEYRHIVSPRPIYFKHSGGN